MKLIAREYDSFTLRGMPFDACPCDEIIDSYVANSLEEGAVATLEEHLLLCATCGERVSQAQQYHAAAREACSRLRSQERKPALSLLSLIRKKE